MQIRSWHYLKDMWYQWWNYQLLPHEFDAFNLYHKPRDEQSSYIGLAASKRVWSYHNRNKSMESTFSNKLSSFYYFQSMDVPLPEFISVMDKTISPRVMNTRLTGKTPLFAKPCYGSGGEGCFIIREADRLNDVYERIGDQSYIFQELLKPASWVEKITKSKAVATVRFVTCYEVRWSSWAFIKLPGPNNIVDNFNVPGNRLEAIDMMTGQFGGLHTIPDWDQYVDLAMKIAKYVYEDTYYNTSLLGIDIAITDRGPVVIEANTKPGLRSLQLALGRGLRYEL